MNSKFYLGAAAAALVLSGIGFEMRERTASGGVSFINPLLFVQSLCGDDAGALEKRRAFFIRAARAYAQETKGLEAAVGDAHAIDGIAYEITTGSEDAQTKFDTGLAYMWNFNHGEAVKWFRAAQAADPECAMCYWGEGFALGPNINAPMDDESVAPAFAAVKKATELRNGASEKEQALITALGYRYEAQPLADRSKLDNAFADAMDDVAKKYVDDDFIAILAAEANMDSQAWDYWMSDGRTPKGRTGRTVSLIEGVLARKPDHIAAIHLYIHITEATKDPYRAAPYAEHLAQLSPGLGHLIHMPSHTYYRIGRFQQSLASNIDAVAADEAYLAKNDASPIYEFGYYVHNVHFVLTSALMAGDGPTALDMAAKLDEKLPKEMALAVPFAQPIKAAPYYAMARFADPQRVLDLPDPGADVPFLQGNWHYARGEAYARMGDAENARKEAEAIARIVAEEDMSTLESFNVPALDILTIARLTVTGRAAAAEEDFGTAIEALTEAVAIQENIAYTEPPFWYYPAKQTLAAMVLRNGDAERAEHLFLETLAELPNNGWVLYGLSESYVGQGDRNGSKYAMSLFKEAWAGDKKAISLASL